MSPPAVLPSVSCHGVGTLIAVISQLNTLPARAPVNASMAASRLATHDSGSGWLAMPFLCDSFIHYSTPVCRSRVRTLSKLPCATPRPLRLLRRGFSGVAVKGPRAVAHCPTFGSGPRFPFAMSEYRTRFANRVARLLRRVQKESFQPSDTRSSSSERDEQPYRGCRHDQECG